MRFRIKLDMHRTNENSEEEKNNRQIDENRAITALA